MASNLIETIQILVDSNIESLCRLSPQIWTVRQHCRKSYCRDCVLSNTLKLNTQTKSIGDIINENKENQS